MEKGKEYLAKIIDRESEFLISEKYVIIGRSNLIKFSDEVEEILNRFEGVEIKNIPKIDLGDKEKIPIIAGIIKFSENKSCFTYTNLSAKPQFVKNKILNKFESIKLKNKSPICISNHMYFFVFSKSILMSYYKFRVEKLSKRNKNKELVNEQGMINNGHIINNANNGNLLNLSQSKVIPVTQVKPADSTSSQVNIKSKSKKKKISANNKKDSPSVDKLLNQGNSSTPMNYQLDNILQPPSRNNYVKSESENILDDLIEAPCKIKIANFNK